MREWGCYDLVYHAIADLQISVTIQTDFLTAYEVCFHVMYLACVSKIELVVFFYCHTHLFLAAILQATDPGL